MHVVLLPSTPIHLINVDLIKIEFAHRDGASFEAVKRRKGREKEMAPERQGYDGGGQGCDEERASKRQGYCGGGHGYCGWVRGEGEGQSFGHGGQGSRQTLEQTLEALGQSFGQTLEHTFETLGHTLGLTFGQTFWQTLANDVTTSQKAT